MPKTFELTLRLRNNLLKSRRRELGLSQPALAEQIGISTHLYMRMECLKYQPLRKPTNKRPEVGWCAAALRVAEFFRVLPEDLWPDGVLQVRHTEVRREFDSSDLPSLLSNHQARLLASPEELLIEQEEGSTAGRLRRALESLSVHEQAVLTERYGLDGGGEKTLRETGRTCGVTPERIRQIEAKALRKLRHPLRMRILKPPQIAEYRVRCGLCGNPKITICGGGEAVSHRFACCGQGWKIEWNSHWNYYIAVPDSADVQTE